MNRLILISLFAAFLTACEAGAPDAAHSTDATAKDAAHAADAPHGTDAHAKDAAHVEGTAPVDGAAAHAGPIVAGSIALAAGLEPKAQAIYVSVRGVGQAGPPLAAKKLPVGPFPLAFEITAADRPMGDGPIPEAIEVKVTLDSDGDPMSKEPTDPSVTVPAKPGQTDLAVELGTP